MWSSRASGQSASRCAELFLFQAWCPGPDRTDRLHASNRNLARRYAERSWALTHNLDHVYPLNLVARQKTATAQAGGSAFARTVRQLAACNDRVASGQSGHE